jgi:UDP-2-acetamido-3-amino-2,3-dideoxy-glucuronate N-acetyltransferase
LLNHGGIAMSGLIPRIAVIGSGYWGKNLVRNFHELGALHYVCDTQEEALKQARENYEVKTTASFNMVLADPEVDGLAIAVPAARHFELARCALLAGKDVFVEKPLALNTRDGQELVRLAEERNKILMVGHILEYHPAILELKRLIREGELGRIQYIYSSRLNLGKLRTEENILWSFAPHDISAILFLLGEMPERISSHGGNYLDSRIYDTTLTTCDFKSGVKAHIFVSWLHPFKEQKLAIVGSSKMAVFDDIERENKLVLYSHRIDWRDRMPVAHKDGGHPVFLAKEEPLRRECEHFLNCIRTREAPRTDGRSAVRVLQVLQSCEDSLRAKGQPVEVAHLSSEYFAHSTAVIDAGCEIGRDTRIWHFSHVMSGSKLGEGCNLGQNVVIGTNVKIGNNVKIQNNVSVYTGVELEDDVFCGPSIVFTNVINPRSQIIRKHEYRKTLVRKGASIGANATIVCGVTLGQYSFVGAGAVVTHDVPDYALVIGVPAVQSGWICSCGIRLANYIPEVTCSSCGRCYRIEGGVCRDVSAAAPSRSDFSVQSVAAD